MHKWIMRLVLVALAVACSVMISCDGNSDGDGGCRCPATTTPAATCPATTTTTTTVVDTTPDPFNFIDQLAALPNTTNESNTITVSGINAPAAISFAVTAGSLHANDGYSVNGGAYTTAPGTVVNGDQVRLRLQSHAALGGSKACTLIIGGVAGKWILYNVL